MFRKNLIAALFSMISLASISPLFASDYKSIIAPQPNVDPVPNILPVEPGIDLPIRSILPVEPIMDPVRGGQPGSDLPLRSVLPVEPMPEEPRDLPSSRFVSDPDGSNEPIGDRPVSDLPIRVVMPVEPMPAPIGDPDNSNQPVGDRPISDLPIRVVMPVEPMPDPIGDPDVEKPVSDLPVRSIMPVEPMPVRMNFPALRPITEPRDIVSRRPVNVLPPEFSKSMPYNPRGNYAVLPGVTEPGDMPRNPFPVEPSPRRPVRMFSPEQSKEGVMSQANRRIVTPIIMPNPLVSQRAVINFQAAQVSGNELQLSVYDLGGRVVVSRKLAVSRDGMYDADLGRLSNGTYLLRLSAPGVDATQKLVVQR